MIIKFFVAYILASILISCTLLSFHPTNEFDQTDDLKVSIADTIRIDTIENKKVKEISLPPYQATREKDFDLVHTTLDLKIDWEQEKIYGDAIVHLSPHFKSEDKVQLDALGLFINSIKLRTDTLQIPLQYSYNDTILDIDLACTFSRNDTIIIEIDYSAIPSTLYERGLTKNPYKRGLSFVKAEDTEDGVCPQTWSINQTNSASCWFPTIDSPNQRMTQDFYITVHDRMMALSNGELVYSTLTREDSSRTFYWKLDKPHPPYLTSLNIGNFVRISDKWNDVNVDYYVSKKYENEAQNIFGNTPEMIDLFSALFNTPYPWKKYGQVAVSNYMYGGAMENNTLTIFHDFIQTNARERLDGNNEGIISHELAHQWFGNYVTCEAWSGLTLNESYATYCEYLWYDYKYGKTEAEIRLYDRLNDYLSETEYFVSPTIQYHYNNSEWDVFNSHTYDKGSLILHQLRKQLGSDVFFESTHQYLKNNKLNSVNIEDLQKAFEDVSGKDLHVFFKQWYHTKGHPELKISSKYDDENEQIILKINQSQIDKGLSLFTFPIEIEVFTSNNELIKREIVIENKEHIIAISVEHEPKIIRVNTEKTILAQTNYENYILDYDLAIRKLKTYSEKRFILNSLDRKDISDSIKINALLKLMNDSIWKIRELACVELIEFNIDSLSAQQKNELLLSLKNISKNDVKSLVRAEAVSCLGKFSYEKVKKNLFEATKDSSYWVMSMAFAEIFEKDYNLAYELSVQARKKDKFADYLLEIYSEQGKENCNDYFTTEIESRKGNDKFEAIDYYKAYLKKQKNDSLYESAFDKVKIYAKNSHNWEVRRHSLMLLSQIVSSLEKNEMLEKYENFKSQFDKIIENENEKRVLFRLKF